MTDYLLVLPLFLMVAYYVGAPILLYVSLKIAANPTLQPFSLSVLPPEALHYFIENSERLTAEGFQSRGEYEMGSDDPDTQTIFVALTHPETGDHAVITAVLLRFSEAWRPLMQRSEITTRLADGSRLASTNQREPNWFPATAAKRIVRFASAQDPRELYRLHRRAVAVYAPDDAPPAVLAQTDTAARLLQEFHEDCEAQVHAKILFLDPSQGLYHPTLRGAFRLTWRMLFPFSAALLLRDRARAAALNAKLLTPE